LQTIGERLKEIREYLRLSQEELGSQIGLTKSGISCVEKNKSFMSKEVLSKLIIDLNVNLNYLVAGIGEMFISDKNTKDEDFDKKVEQKVTELLKKHGLSD
jgi:transcriptional regulator with XRE-family HTH domain